MINGLVEVTQECAHDLLYVERLTIGTFKVGLAKLAIILKSISQAVRFLFVYLLLLIVGEAN